MFELLRRVNLIEFNKDRYSKLKTSVEIHSLENRSYSKLPYSKYFKCIMYFVKMRKGLKLEASIAVCSTEIKAEKEISWGKLHVCLYFAWTAISLNPKTAAMLRFYAVATAMFTLFTSTGSLRGSHLPELHPPFTRTNRSPQSPILLVEMVYFEHQKVVSSAMASC